MVTSDSAPSVRVLLSRLSEGAGPVVAGGTDLMVKRRGWTGTVPTIPADAVYVANLRELRFVRSEGDAVAIGAATPLETLLDHPLVPGLLKQAVAQTAGPAIRHVATLAGNLANASPAADPALVLACLSAVVVVESLDGIREVPADRFATGPGRTVLRSDELVTRIVIPAGAWNKTAFVKVGGRRADAISKVSFAGAVALNDGVITAFRVAFGAVGPTILVPADVAGRLVGSTPEEARSLLPGLMTSLSDHIRPIDDQRSTAAYRRQVALNLFADFIASI
jgi:CO/xanthine dehydrogenase FAD-binding subunit